MTFSRRHISKALLGGAALAAAPWLRAQAAFPSKPMKIIVPTPPGGTLDFMARVMSERLTTVLGQPVIVENRTGASSSIGTRYVGQSAPDGHTLLMMANTFASTPATLPSANYDPVKDFTGVGMLGRVPNVLIVPANSPYKTLAELVAAARARPGEITYASAGNGSVGHFSAARMAHQLNLKLIHVPFKGNGDALIDMVAGRVNMMFDQLSSSLQHIKGGRLRALGITSSARSDVIADVPTFAESGYKDFEDYVWLGFMVPAATPKDIVAKLNAACVQIVRMPEVRARFGGSAVEAVGGSAEDFTGFVRSEVARLAKLAQDANIKLE